MSCPILTKCLLKLKQFDGSSIKLLGKFKATIESSTKMNI